MLHAEVRENCAVRVLEQHWSKKHWSWYVAQSNRESALLLHAYIHRHPEYQSLVAQQ
jgi:hypothetical protein